MSLESRVTALEENRVHWDQVLTGIEGSVALILKEQINLKKQVEQLDKRVDQFETRFDQLELLIRQLIPNANN